MKFGRKKQQRQVLEHARAEVDAITMNVDEIIDGTFDSVCLSRQIIYRLDEIKHRLNRMEQKMSALSDAVEALKARIEVDVQHLRDQVVEAFTARDAALANDAADAQTIADAKAETAAAIADADAAVVSITSIDPVADFPAVEPPA